MDPTHVLNTLRDPAGIPAHPVIFEVLLVLTWVVHIAFVMLALGAAGLAIYAFHSSARGEWWSRLSLAMTQTAKVCVSLLIVTGVAPLLFTQVIYDPQWYASNVLSGRWVIAFILNLIVAYCLWFAFMYANTKQAKRYVGVYAWVAFALFCLDGGIMHALSYQSLLPGGWMSWYAPGGSVNTSGAGLYAFQWPRYLFIMGMSIPMIGTYLFAYAKYFETNGGYSAVYLDFVRGVARRLSGYGFLLTLLPLLGWQFLLPASTGLGANPVGWLLFASIAGAAGWTLRRDPARNAYLPLAAALVVVTILGLWREVIRIAYLRPFGYTIMNYPVHYDASMVLFFLTLLGVGGAVGGFFLTLLYKSGRVQGTYNADTSVSRLGTVSVGMLAFWMIAFLLFGVLTLIRNSFIT
ncbi:MAG: hypothetical protein WAJ85_05060 [Candidatus Baltobacteraceae bacterium]